MDSYKIESKLGLIMIQSLDYSNNPKTRRVYPHMIVDEGLKYKDMKVKDMKINNWKCKKQKSKEKKCKKMKNNEQRTQNNAKLCFQL